MVALPVIYAVSSVLKSVQTGAVTGFFVTKRRDILLTCLVGSLSGQPLTFEDWPGGQGWNGCDKQAGDGTHVRRVL
ncbi:hypothetical protein AERO9A_370145 [Aeromonas salmonicida]|nr:hypothetical protein AERO9A_370145 [Aeromonas salmonicida]